MKRLLIGLVLAAVSIPASAGRDERLFFPIEDVYANDDLKLKISPEVKLFFGKQTYPDPEQSYGVFTANRKTNFLNKSDKEACEIAFVSAVVALQERAQKEGGNAVVGIRNVYRKDNFVSETEYECGAGNVIGGVALQGEVVKLP
ncbi:MAG TPA: hypothetical protein VFB36_12635 [Nevskiaceae bacterium]|nr:hypothetical protein [Nevskiaceae bacterium]